MLFNPEQQYLCQMFITQFLRYMFIDVCIRWMYLWKAHDLQYQAWRECNYKLKVVNSRRTPPPHYVPLMYIHIIL